VCGGGGTQRSHLSAADGKRQHPAGRPTREFLLYGVEMGDGRRRVEELDD